MNTRLVVAACLLVLATAGVAGAHVPAGGRDSRSGHQHGEAGGHLPASRENVELVGKLRVADAVPGRIADVGAFKDFAYLAAFDEPGCTRGGVYVIDIADPRSPREVGFIPAHLGSYVGEGVHVIHLETPAYEGDVLAHNNETCAEGGEGGISLWDVTDPLNPQALAENVGDTHDASGAEVPVREYHSVFIWQQGDRAYAVASDDLEQGTTDVDIIEITDPRHPELIAETGLADWPAAQAPLAKGESAFNHDMIVRRIRGRWTMLVSYWDAGYVELDVNDPAHPRFLRDSDFTNPDPVSRMSPAEGNGHYAEFDRTGRLVIGTDEDFEPDRADFRVTTGPAAGPFEAGLFGFSASIRLLSDQMLNGPTVFGGYGCDDDTSAIPPASSLGPLAPGEEATLVLSRGPAQDPDHPHDPCFFDQKVANAAAAGYGGVIIANHHVGSRAGEHPDATACGSGDPRPIPALCLGHRALHLMFGRVPAYAVPYPAGDPGDLEPNPGDAGPNVEAHALFDGWGYIHLFEAGTLRELDTYAIPEEEDPAFSTGYGPLSVHEVTFDPHADLAYLSWYAGGFRVVSVDDGRLREVGHFIDEGGNDFWGVQIHRDDHRRTLVLASDRDSGLYVFRYTGRRP
jgi:hypothetical protein